MHVTRLNKIKVKTKGRSRTEEKRNRWNRDQCHGDDLQVLSQPMSNSIPTWKTRGSICEPLVNYTSTILALRSDYYCSTCECTCEWKSAILRHLTVTPSRKIVCAGRAYFCNFRKLQNLSCHCLIFVLTKLR